MNYSRGESDRREVEKTPLIDVIFLLLIFFFVSLTTQSYMAQSKERSQEKSKQNLLRMANPDPIIGTDYICFELKDLNHDHVPASLITQLNAIRAQLVNFAGPCRIRGGALPVIAPGNGTLLMPVSMDTLSDKLHSFSQHWAGVGGCPPAMQAQLNELIEDFPFILNKLNNAAIVTGKIQTLFPQLIQNPQVTLHLRVDKWVSMRALGILYQAFSQLNISYKNILIRVLKENRG